ncbi:Fucosyltransferase 3 [Cardamine amara subsp. amara]|uniref:Fucosyltransferase n=1 Tax=Cardamine amara subsp. amara TaxID=228776 RepID=A0ABD1BDM3_CARAN
MKRGKKSSDAGDPVTNSDTRTGSSELDAMRPNLSSMKSMGLLLAVLMAASVMFSLSVVLRDPPSDDVVETEAASRVILFRFHQAIDSDGGLSEKKEQLDDVLVHGFDKESCLRVDMADLFCEPFPNTSWFLPLEFPLKSQFNGQSLLHDSGNSLFAYRHVVRDSSDQQKLFFCDESQVLLEETQWLILKTDSFFLPSLFSTSSFEQELEKIFPEKEMAFYFLGQYLFHPTNVVWGLITRYYHAYLARAEQKIGIYIGVSESGNDQFQHLVDQILACGTKHKLLPEVEKQRHLPSSQVLNRKSKAVFISSASPGYFESIRDVYWENPTVTGEIISVHKPSHKEFQKTQRNMESRRAWAEIYLLSCTDVLVGTSLWSSVMDVAHGLGGLKPWVLNKAENGTAYEPYCVRARSMEPCSQTTLFHSCKVKDE